MTNQRKIQQELREFSDIKLVKTGPTRGRQALDLTFTNFPEYIKECGTLPALFNQDGVTSDHSVDHIKAKMPRVVDYTIERYSYIKQTKEGDEKFSNLVDAKHWDEIMDMNNPNEMVGGLHDFFEEAMGLCYETITTTRKSNQP